MRVRFRLGIFRSVWLWLLLGLLVSVQAREIQVHTDPNDPESRIEFRPITLPDGSQAELIVIQGNPVTVTFDDNEIIANHIEYDRENQLLRIVGPGQYRAEEVTTEGEDFIVDLDDEAFRVRDVLVITEQIDILGLDATRVPGQLEVGGGWFSPCARCAQDIEDYAFQAKELRLYPGDRLVAHEVTVLIRGVPMFFLPILIYPLGPEQRQPRLSIGQGTDSERAEVDIDWPYTAGANAFGTLSLRYFADITPGEGTFLSNNLLGGRIDESYLGGGVDHRFFTDEGEGRLHVFYIPSFVDESEEDGKTRDELTLRVRYRTLEILDIPQYEFLLERVDERRQRIVEYTFRFEEARDGLAMSFLSRGYMDLDPTRDPRTPSYASRTTPERTIMQLGARPEASGVWQVGPFQLREPRIELGVFQDASNPSNRRAAQQPTASAARILAGHRIDLESLDVWSGLTLSGRTTFRGQYYSSQERLIDWASRLEARQRFGDIGNLNVTFDRNTREGETPFRFDQTSGLATTTNVRGTLSLTPTPWLTFDAEHTYVFVDSRNRANEGPGSLDTRLRLFDNLNWLSFTARNSFDIQENDPGTLELDFNVRTPSRDRFTELTVNHVQDLKPSADRNNQNTRSESSTDLRVRAGYRPYIEVDVQSGYRYDPPEVDDPEEPREFWEPLDITLTAGTLDLGDNIPGFRVNYVRDLNRNELLELGLRASASYGPLEAEYEQRYNVTDARLQTGRYQLRWQGIAAFEASGFGLLSSSLLGIEIDEERTQNWRFDLRDATRTSSPLWRLTYRTTLVPTLEREDGGTGGFRERRLEGFVNLEDTELDGIRFRVDLASELQIADDDRIDNTHLRSARLDLLGDFYSRVGVQGRLGYRATYSLSEQEVTRGALSLEDFGVSVRVSDQLYLAAIFNDVWDLTGNVEAERFAFQPTLHVVWDRCCWALYGSWDTESGRIRLAVTTPGGTEGIQQEIDTPLVLPGRNGNDGN